MRWSGEKSRPKKLAKLGLPIGGFAVKGKPKKLESYLDVLYILLEDVLLLAHGISPIRNEDVRPRLEPVARKVSFDWLRRAAERVDELAELLRRNIQKSIALDAFAAGLRPRA